VSLNINDLLNVLNIINDISQSVKILAINASIIAAKAETGGKAFSVIANEIRKFSDMTNKNAANISKQLNLS